MRRVGGLLPCRSCRSRLNFQHGPLTALSDLQGRRALGQVRAPRLDSQRRWAPEIEICNMQKHIKVSLWKVYEIDYFWSIWLLGAFGGFCNLSAARWPPRCCNLSGWGRRRRGLRPRTLEDSVLGGPGRSRGRLGGPWVLLCAPGVPCALVGSLGRSLAVLGAPWALLASSWTLRGCALARSWALLCLGRLRAPWARLGAPPLDSATCFM